MEKLPFLASVSYFMAQFSVWDVSLKGSQPCLLKEHHIFETKISSEPDMCFPCFVQHVHHAAKAIDLENDSALYCGTYSFVDLQLVFTAC